MVYPRGKVPAVLKTNGDGEAQLPTRVTSHNEKTKAEADIPRQTSIFSWKDVVYDIKIKGEPRRILDHVDGWVKPGTLTALMVCPSIWHVLTLGCFGSGKDDIVGCFGNSGDNRCGDRRDSRGRSTEGCQFSTDDGICSTKGHSPADEYSTRSLDS